MKRTLGFAILGAAAIAACEGDGLGPQSGPLTLEASIGQSTVRSLDTTSIVFRIRNTGDDSITVDLSGCVLRMYVRTWDNNPVISGGSCRGQDVRTIAPGADVSKSVAVRACASYLGPAMLQNRYKAYARFVDLEHEMQSRIVEFRVICT